MAHTYSSISQRYFHSGEVAIPQGIAYTTDITPKMSGKRGEHWEIAAFEMSRKRTQPLWENDTCQDCKCPPEECECDKCTFCGFPYPCKCVAAEVTRSD